MLAFEKEFAEFNGNKHALAVGNCTQGLEIAVKAAMMAVSRADSCGDSSGDDYIYLLTFQAG